jgi:gamma-glutamyltranspeptidase / glutathione hydrolase
MKKVNSILTIGTVSLFFIFSGSITANAIEKISIASAGNLLEARAEVNAGVHSAISTPHPEAKKAASEILAKGGNAVDAAVASLLTLAVVQTSNVGIAGYGGSIVIYSAKDAKVYSIDFDSRAPFAFKPDNFNEQSATYGYLAVGVPGIVSGLELALKNHGTLSWKVVSQHAYDLASKGLVVDEKLNRALHEFTQHADKASIAAYLPNGIPEVGSVWVQKDLAKVIKAIGDGGADAFYKGEIAQRIVKHFREHGGILSEDDFSKYHAQEVEPVKINYRGNDIYSPPVPSAGLTSLSIVKTLENFDLSKIKPFGAEYFNLFAQSSKIVWGERFKYLGDPDFVKFPADYLLSDKLAAERAEKIRTGNVVAINPSRPEPLHTVNVVVIDKDQNIVSLTATQGGGYGSNVAVPGTGLVFGHGISRFDYTPGPNYPEPGKRMQHNMAPIVVLRNGKPLLGLGLPGGRFIVTVTSQLLIDVLDFKQTPEQAVKAPRVHNEGDNILKVSKDVSDADIRELESKGFKVDRVSNLGGPANVVIIDQVTGKIEAASEAGPTGVQIQ